MDNFYSSVDLSEAFLAQKVHLVGTLRNNRGEPLTLRNLQRMQHHKVIAVDNGKVMILAWKDKQIVKAISTKHDGSVCSIMRRKKGGHGAMEKVMKSVFIVDYNQHMSEVDHLEKMINHILPLHQKITEVEQETFLLPNGNQCSQLLCFI